MVYYQDRNGQNISYITEKDNKITLYTEIVCGAYTNWNIFLASSFFIIGLNFLYIGICNYFFHERNLMFLPEYMNFFSLFEGIGFFSCAVILICLSSFLFFLIKKNLGSGTNLFDIKNNLIRIKRKSLVKSTSFIPFYIAEITITYQLSAVSNLELYISSGFNPERVTFLVMKDGRRIPLLLSTKIDDLEYMQNRAYFLENILLIPLKRRIVKN